MDRNLLEILEGNPSGLEQEYIRKIMYQITKAIDFCHSHEVIHRDVKPENLLISKENILKICDFGFARVMPKNV